MADQKEERFDRVESHMAHLERQMEELNGVVIEQGKLLDRLRKEVQRQSSLMQAVELAHIKDHEQKPPHYQ